VRCVPCDELTEHLAKLEIPVVLVAHVWALAAVYFGVGLVLIDRWREVGYCTCRVPTPGRWQQMAPIARARASHWAPTGTIVSLDRTDDWDGALLETLRRVRAEWHHLVRGRFDDAAGHARWLADGVRDRAGLGTRVAPPPDGP